MTSLWSWISALQALGVPFEVMGTSEPNSLYRDYQLANFPGIQHMHSTMEEQHMFSPCNLHPRADECRPCDGESPQLACFGTPCPPFSRQRQKRFASGSVKQHKAFEVTFVDAFRWLQAFEPIVAVMEQVEGFNIKESADVEQTPYARHKSRPVWGNWNRV